MADAYPTCDLIRTLSTLALLIRDYEDSYAKSAVYNTIIGLTTEIPRFRERVNSLEFFHPPLVMMPMESGMVAYTWSATQLNVHFAIPQLAAMTIPMMHEMAERLDDPKFDRYAINMRPLRTTTPDVEGVCVRRCRRIPRLATDLEIIDDRYLQFEDTVVQVEEVFSDPRRVLRYVPLTTATSHDVDTLVYWTRARCGRLVAFRNPTVPIAEAETDLPVVDDLPTLLSCFAPRHHAFVRALYPRTIEDTVDALRDRLVPYRVKTMLVQMCISCFGLRDELILEVGAMVETGRIAANPLHLEMMQMTLLMRASYIRNNSHRATAQSLVRSLAECEDQEMWRQWTTHSPFVCYMCEVTDVTTVRLMCEAYTCVRSALQRMLRSRIGQWEHADRQKAILLQTLLAKGGDERAGEEDGVRAVLTELGRLNDRAQRSLKDIVDAECATTAVAHATAAAAHATAASAHATAAAARATTVEKREQTDAAAAAGREGEHDDADADDVTHHELVDALARRWPNVRWTLIGSGVFSDASDVDVVVTVPAAADDDDPLRALKAAYDRVRELTGYEQRGAVDGRRVCTLHGTWDDGRRRHPVDVQVETEGGTTESERTTAQAVSLAQRLQREGDARMRRNLRLVHRWFASADLKGNHRCHLPGVAVTCLTVVASRHGTLRTASSVAHALEAVLERVRRDRPHVDLDSWADEGGAPRARRRPERAIEVVVNERNVAARVTTAWTRHLCDSLLFAMTLTLERVFVPEVYAAWRRRSMVYCATFRPRSDASLAVALHSSLTRVEMHPLVDSLHAGSDGQQATDVVLRCTLNEGCASDHTFRRGDTVDPYDGYVMVTRGTRRTRLNTSPGDAPPFDATEAETADCRLMFGSGRRERFPNAPFLSADAVQAFSPAHFTVV